MSTGAIHFDILQIFVIQKVKDDWKKIHVCSISTSASSKSVWIGQVANKLQVWMAYSGNW